MASEKVVPDKEVSMSLQKRGHRRTQASRVEGHEVVARGWCLELEISEEV